MTELENLIEITIEEFKQNCENKFPTILVYHMSELSYFNSYYTSSVEAFMKPKTILNIQTRYLNLNLTLDSSKEIEVLGKKVFMAYSEDILIIITDMI